MWLQSSTRELQWLEYLKSVFLKIPYVTTWSVFQNQVTYVNGPVKMDHKIWPQFSNLLHHNYSSAKAIEVKFLLSINNLIANSLRCVLYLFTESKCCTQNSRYYHFVMWYICANLVLFTGPVTYVTWFVKTRHNGRVEWTYLKKLKYKTL